MAYGKDAERARAPHWMRSMEEKYQRLHARVADHAARYSQSRNSLSVRLRELRQRKYHAQQRTQCKSSSVILKNTLTTDNGFGVKDQSPDRSMLVSSAVDFIPNRSLQSPKKPDKSVDVYVRRGKLGCNKRSSSATAWTTIPSSNDKTGISNNISVHPVYENYSDADVASKEICNEKNRSGIKTDISDENHHSNSTCNECNDAESRVSEEKNSSKDKERMREIRPFSVPRVKNSKSKSNEDRNWKEKDRNNTYSRTLPHRKIYSKSAMPLLSGKPSEELSALVFSTMSQEAQHAKHETLKDMTSEYIIKAYNDGKNDDTIHEHFNVKNDISEGCETTLTKDGQDDNPSNDFTEGLHLKPDICDKDSSTSSRSSDAECDKEFSLKHRQNVRQRLKATPYFEPGKCHEYSPKQHNNKKKLHFERLGGATKDHFLAHRSPLPAIPQTTAWHAHRDNSFDITSPEFDVRFCRTVFSSKEEREEPPEDIRRQSIEKCRLWLERQLGRL